MPNFLDLVRDILDANGWSCDLVAEPLPSEDGDEAVRVRRAQATEPLQHTDIVNEYHASVTAPDQVQYDCLRFLRTGRIGA